ncbi:hypothetical protein Stube_36560 [Streptomyces tubercidicus]|uniref:Uncharacterized protein n=1 Tax=Streptomyces tubercidicus TaxID=47759 RepID=A0A640USI2_9ACTN|nr:hypothetical protein Stube_36560 [Streptomyces tubercidicus]
MAITDVTPLAREVHARVRAGETAAATAPLPQDHPYPAPEGTPGLGRVSWRGGADA